MSDLRKAAEMAYKVMTDIHQVCEGANHKRKDMHPHGGDCPIQKRFDDAWEALRQALAQPEQRPVGTYEGVMETMLSLRKGTFEQQQIYTHMKDKLLYTAPQSIEAAVLAEREACAKVCDEALLQLNETANQIEESEYMEKCVIQGAMTQSVKLGKAIRARSEK